MNDRGAKERGFGTPPVEENGERRDEAATPAVPAAVHIEGRGGSASVKGCTAKDRWGERHGEEDDYGEKGGGRKQSRKSLEKLGESPRCARFSLRRGLNLAAECSSGTETGELLGSRALSS